MEAILIVVTFVSIAIAVVALAAVLRLQRTERQRSDARIAALSAAAETHGATDGGWKQVAGEWQWVASSSPETRPMPPAAAHRTPMTQPARAEHVQIRPELPLRPERVPLLPDLEFAAENGPAAPRRAAAASVAADSAAPGIAFGTVERGEATTGRLPLYAAAVLIVILGSAMLFLRTSSHDDRPATAQAAAHDVSPLELVSLSHNRETKSLTISGMVRNPASGHTLEGLTAVVSLLDTKGGLISTKDVPLDYRALGPGEEAPFTVSVPDPGAIARYRVSFRAGTEVVPHIDRRPETKLASAVR
jgi:hypothetical protein